MHKCMGGTILADKIPDGSERPIGFSSCTYLVTNKKKAKKLRYRFNAMSQSLTSTNAVIASASAITRLLSEITCKWSSLQESIYKPCDYLSTSTKVKCLLQT